VVGATSSEGFLVMNDKNIMQLIGAMYVQGAPKSNKFVAHVVQQHA